MSRRRKQKWGVGDVFEVPLRDGSAAIGQVIALEPGAMKCPICAFYAEKWRDDVSPKLIESDLIAVLFVTPDLLDSGVWTIVGSRLAIKPDRFVALDELRRSNFVGLRIIGSGIVRELVEAFDGLIPWDRYHDPNYLDGLLAPGRSRPSSARFSRPH
ncbi:Imm26 family immunity protein [Solimonas terrae]|uniref:Uncharacterized protein n=1 Tax=Solimonas terrae TaxID=1396819 RepID=A0A6M2BMK9_9GAMM|nr:Imm26 family immunity protein [Solimonas terrae]NGY03668.1 hypothetical protein [Solimonas terrae]